MEVDPEDIFITSGATQALHLLVDLLYKEGHAFALESPSHQGIRTVVADKGYPLHWMPVDNRGADISSSMTKAFRRFTSLRPTSFRLAVFFPPVAAPP